MRLHQIAKTSRSTTRPGSADEQLAVRGEPLDARAHREHRDERSRDQARAAIGDAGDEQRDYACETCPPHGGERTNGPGVRPEQVERPAVQEEQALRPIDPDVPVEVGAAGPEAGDGGVPALVDGERDVEEAQPHEHREQRDRDDAEREDAAFTRRRIALLVGGYAVGLGGMVATRGLYLTPDRYFLILLVPALALGVARRYVLDFLPFIALIILYEVTRGVAHILRPHPYYAPQLDIDRWLFAEPYPRSGCRISCGTVTCPGGRPRCRC